MIRAEATEQNTEAPPQALLSQHQKLIADSGITSEVAEARGYRSATTRDDVALFAEEQRRVPALLLPVWTVDGTNPFEQIRPDVPRSRDGKIVKYETPARQRMVIDVPPSVRDDLGDPTIPLLITEGVRKADAAASAGYCCIDLLGVDAWRGSNEKNGKTALADWEKIALNGRAVYIVFDSDAATKASVQKAIKRLKTFLESRMASVFVVRLDAGPNGAKVGLDDFLVAGGDLDGLMEQSSTETMFEPAGKLTERLDDIGDARRFAQQNRGDVAWSPHLGKWLVFKSEQRGSGLGGRWVEDIGDIEVLRRAKLMVDGWYTEALTLAEDDKKKLLAHAIQCGAIYRLKNILLSAHTELNIDITTFDQDDWLLNCQNGLLDLRTGTLRPAMPEDRCRWQADVEYVLDATDARFARYLTENIPNPTTREFYQEIAGYMLTGDRRLDAIAYAHGPKGSGKTTFAEIARKSLGSYAATVPPEFFMVTGKPLSAEANRPLLASLVNKRLITSAEGNKAHEFDVAFVKRLTGREAVTACAKHKDPFEYVPKFFCLLYGNHRPSADFTEDAMRRRFFEQPFKIGHDETQADPSFRDYLLNESAPRRAWLAWAVEGLLRLVKEKQFRLVKPAEVKASTAEYWTAQNILGPFLMKLVLDPLGFIPSSVLNVEFDAWAMDTDTKAERADLIRWLKEQKCENESLRIPGGKTQRGWKGVRLASEPTGVTLSRLVTPLSGKSPIRDSQRKFPETRVTTRDGVTDPTAAEFGA